jgi:hypothetical protein
MPTEGDYLVNILAILQIEKSKEGVSVQVLEELDTGRGRKLLRLRTVDWGMLKDWGVHVRRLISKTAYELAEKLSCIKSGEEEVIFARCLDEVVCCPKGQKILEGGHILAQPSKE